MCVGACAAEPRCAIGRCQSHNDGILEEEAQGGFLNGLTSTLAQSRSARTRRMGRLCVTTVVVLEQWSNIDHQGGSCSYKWVLHPSPHAPTHAPPTHTQTHAHEYIHTYTHARSHTQTGIVTSKKPHRHGYRHTCIPWPGQTVTHGREGGVDKV